MFLVCRLVVGCCVLFNVGSSSVSGVVALFVSMRKDASLKVVMETERAGSHLCFIL